MKKRLLFSLMALFMLSVVLVSCKDDDDNDSDSKAAIIGKWTCKSEILYVDGKQDEEETFIATADEYMTYEFKSDGTVTFTEYGPGNKVHGTSTDKWSISGNKLTFTWTDSDTGKEESDAYTFSISGNTLTMTAEETEEGHTYKEVDTYVKL